jgi:hypothetical protein
LCAISTQRILLVLIIYLNWVWVFSMYKNKKV